MMVRNLSVFIALLAMLGAPVVVLAQGDDPPPESPSQPAPDLGPPQGLESPRDTADTFFRAIRAWEDDGEESALEDAARCLDLSDLAFANEIGPDIALHVHEAALDLGFTRRSRLPGRRQVARDESSSWSAPFGGETIRFVRADDRGWRLAGETVSALNNLYTVDNPDPLAKLFAKAGLGALVTGTMLGVPYYQWLAIFVTILIGVMVDFGVRLTVLLVIRHYVRREDDASSRHDSAALIKRAAKPFGLTAGGITVYILLHQFEITLEAAGILKTAAKVFALCAGVWSLYRLADVVAEFFSRKAEATESKFDDLLIPLLRKTVKIFIVAFGLVFVADALDLPIASLLAGIGIGGLAFAFAAKDTIENLFGSVTVILDRPFDVGDWVVVDEVEGIVEELGFRSTRIRTFYNSLVSIPNSTLVRAKVDNYGRRRYRRFSTHLTLTYSTSPESIDAFCEGVRELILAAPSTRKDYFEVHLNRFGAHSLDVMLYMFFIVPDWSAELSARHSFMLDVIRLAKSLDVEFAFPTQTLHIAPQDSGSPSREP